MRSHGGFASLASFTDGIIPAVNAAAPAEGCGRQHVTFILGEMKEEEEEGEEQRRTGGGTGLGRDVPVLTGV